MASNYVSTAALKNRLGIDNSGDDTIILSVCEGVSRAIDNVLSAKRGAHTRFYTTDDDETRYYTAAFEDCLVVDDLISITTLKCDTTGDGVYDTTLTSGDYALMPQQAEQRGQPYTHIQTTMAGGESFTLVPNGVELVGKYGFASDVPDYITEAALLAAMRIYKRKDAIFGSASPLDFNIIQGEIQKDVDVMLLLEGIPVRPRRLQVAR